jgi:tRNA dimethylallyltransferase
VTPRGSGPAGPHAALVGATASGKSALALELARRDPAWELVSVDSMQVYRGMDIGTAKPSLAEQAEVPHHLLDRLDPWEDGTVAWYQREAMAVLADVAARGRRALLVGGTALYLQSVVDELEIPGRYPEVRAELEADADTRGLHARLESLDPTAAARMEPDNRRRVVRALEVTLGSGRPFSSYGPGLDAHPASPIRLVGLQRSPDDLRTRIAARYERQMVEGFLAEVRRLHQHPRGLSRTAAQALGYKELIEHLEERVPLAEAVDLARRRTVRFARRQRAWFRRDPRITWLEASPGQASEALVDPLARLLVPR